MDVTGRECAADAGRPVDGGSGGSVHDAENSRGGSGPNKSRSQPTNRIESGASAFRSPVPIAAPIFRGSARAASHAWIRPRQASAHCRRSAARFGPRRQPRVDPGPQDLLGRELAFGGGDVVDVTLRSRPDGIVDWNQLLDEVLEFTS